MRCCRLEQVAIWYLILSSSKLFNLTYMLSLKRLLWVHHTAQQCLTSLLAACALCDWLAAKACKADAEKLCKNTWAFGPTAEGRIIACLR